MCFERRANCHPERSWFFLFEETYKQKTYKHKKKHLDSFWNIVLE